MMDYFDSSKTNEELDEGALVPVGTHIMQLKEIHTGTSTSSKDGAEYGWWNLRFEVVSTEAKGTILKHFMSFDRPGNLADFVLLKRRKVLAGLGFVPRPGPDGKISIDQAALIGRYVTVEVTHWHNKKRNKDEAQIDEIEPYQTPAPVPAQVQPAAQPAAQAAAEAVANPETPQLPPEEGPPATPAVGEIPF